MRRTYYGDYDYMDRITERRSRRVASARARQVKRRKILLIIGVLITMGLCSFFSVRAFANTDTSADGFGAKKYRSIMIYCGDTVEKIAEANYSFQFASVDRMADEIRSINHISVNEQLIPGNYIVVPYFDMASGY
ncbi:MAG: hypothetical protein IKQ40_01745 [Lachnospiraceae bacterium]|nr:hypothetical protein [Lachnospiraceae bacterium]